MLIPYLGEKSKFSDFIIPQIPLNISTYVEPFGGMFSIFFCLDLSKYPNTKFIYNDINRLNYLIFKNLKDPVFVNKIQKEESDSDRYYQIQKDWINNNWTDYEWTINWIILLCCSYSRYKILDGEWRGNSEFEVFKMKLKWNNFNLDKINEVLNQDYQTVINKYDNKETLFYLDPPYKDREHYYINHPFSEESHYELNNILNNIKGRFILSYYNFAEMKEWYKDYRIIHNNGIMGIEYLIMNF